jgi:hypothetical protein
MILRDLPIPISCAESQGYALVFDSLLAQRLAEIHAEHGNANCVPVPRLLTDGRLILCADILTEIGPGGLLDSMWANCDQDVVLDSVEVMPMAEVVASLPLQESPV